MVLTKKVFRRLPTAVSLVCLGAASAVWARPDQQSLRSQSTAGLFGDSFDILATNPAFLKARTRGEKAPAATPAGGEGGESAPKGKVGDLVPTGKVLPYNYHASPTLGGINVFSNFNDLNDDGSLLLGSAFSVGDFGIGALVEFRKEKSAGNLNNLMLGGNSMIDSTPGNTDLSGLTANTLSGQGSQQITDYYDPAQNGDATEKASLNYNGELYTNYTDVNFKLATAWALNKDFHLGAVYERFTYGTNYLGSNVNSFSTSGSGNYSIAHTDLLTDETLYQVKDSAGLEESTKRAHNVFGINTLLEKVGPFSAMVLEFNADMHSADVQNDMNYDSAITEQNIKNSYQYTEKSDQGESGLLMMPTLSLWMEDLWKHEWEFSLGATFGSMASTVPGTVSDTTVTGTSDSNNSELVNQVTTENKSVMAEKENSVLGFQYGTLLRAEIAKKLLIGYGLRYSYLKTNYVYTDKTSASTTTRANDGNGIVDAADFTSVTSSSESQEIGSSTTVHSVTVPVGVEYRVTPAFSLRFGVSHQIRQIITESTRKTTAAQPEKTDLDRDDIDGNETVGDSYTSTNANPRDRGRNNMVQSITQTNSMSLGLGYNLANRLQLDMALASTFESTGKDYFDSGQILVNATLLF